MTKCDLYHIITLKNTVPVIIKSYKNNIVLSNIHKYNRCTKKNRLFVFKIALRNHFEESYKDIGIICNDIFFYI